jgi:hypothetical protein
MVTSTASGNAKIYLNGDSVRAVAAANFNWGSVGKNTVIGKHGNAHVGLKLGGAVCETRIENTARSSDWIRLCYENQGAIDYLTNPPPQPPALSSPATGTSPYTTPTISLSWTAPSTGPSATSYQVQVSTVNTFGSTVYQNLNVSGTSVVPTGLSVGIQYYWEVAAVRRGSLVVDLEFHSRSASGSAGACDADEWCIRPADQPESHLGHGK